MSPLANITQLATGGAHTCAIIANGTVRCWGQNVFGQIGDGTMTNRLRPVAVPSFALNIDPLVRLTHQGRVATVQVIATCKAGQQLRAHVTLSQGAMVGRGVGRGQCTSRQERYPVEVRAQGRNTFLEGPAEVEAEARLRVRGIVVDTQEWARRVQIVRTPIRP